MYFDFNHAKVTESIYDLMHTTVGISGLNTNFPRFFSIVLKRPFPRSNCVIINLLPQKYFQSLNALVYVAYLTFVCFM